MIGVSSKVTERSGQHILFFCRFPLRSLTNLSFSLGSPKGSVIGLFSLTTSKRNGVDTTKDDERWFFYWKSLTLRTFFHS